MSKKTPLNNHAELQTPDGDLVRNPKTGVWHTGKAFYALLGATNAVKTDAALAMGTTHVTLYRWMKQEVWPDRQIAKACAYLGTRPEWLRTGLGDVYAKPEIGADPRAAIADRMYRQLEARILEMLKTYTASVIDLYTRDAETPLIPKEKRREHNTHPPKGFV